MEPVKTFVPTKRPLNAEDSLRELRKATPLPGDADHGDEEEDGILSVPEEEEDGSLSGATLRDKDAILDPIVMGVHAGSAVLSQKKNSSSLESVSELKKVPNGEPAKSESLDDMAELKRTLMAENKEEEDAKSPESKAQSRAGSHTIEQAKIDAAAEEKRVTFKTRPEETKAVEEKLPESDGEDKADCSPSTEERGSVQGSARMKPSPRTFSQRSPAGTFGSLFQSRPKDQPPVIFSTAPIVQGLEMDYAVDNFGVSHVSFVADVSYDEHRWKVLFHRQNLIEYHTNLKSIQMQRRLGSCNPFRSWSRSRAPEDQLPESTFGDAAFNDDSAQSSSRRGQGSGAQNIHFPRQLLMFDRHHFFHKNVDLRETTAASREVLDQTKNGVRDYLTQILSNETVRNLPITLELLRCSAMTFDKTLGPSVIEGWVRFQKHPPSMGAVQWHTCRTGCVVCSVGCLPISNSRRFKAWIVIKESFAAFLKRPLDTQPIYIVIFDSGFEVLKGFSTTGRRKHIYLHSNTTVADLTFSSRNEKKRWAEYLKLDPSTTSWHCKDHPHGSFAPEREDRCFAKMLVDGHDYFRAVADALEAAESEIYIGGWWITPDIVLKRDPSQGYDYWRLSTVLKRKAAEGVRVYVLMFKEVEVAISLNSKFQESRLAKTPNIFVLRHPTFTLGGQWYWSHHEKYVVVDGVKAFAGGLDLCWGRYDTDAHPLLDLDHPATWPGLDYYNPRVRDIADPRQVDKDILDRSADPRMPWHDVSYTVSGPVARDIARHFIHQWNSAIESRSGSRSDLPLLVPRDFPAYPEPEADHHKVKCQVLRSLPQWSGGPEGSPERSIHDAHLAAIADAQKFVFIENQFFVSGIQGDGFILNRIADALYVRIVRAAVEKKPFKVIVFMPLLPSFEGSVDNSGQTALRQVLYWQYRSICRGDNRRSLWQMLEDHPEVKDPSKYLAFFALRTFDKTQVRAASDGKAQKSSLFTEMIYIHSKVMVVDDNVAFIGSSNINDRSMSGQRDSELCTKFVDVVYRDNAQLAGEPWNMSGAFAHDLRMRLFEEHFGQHLPTEVLDDFVLDAHFEQLKALARRNTEIFEKVFALVPSDRILTFADLRRSGNTGDRPGVVLDADMTRLEAEEDEEFDAASATTRATTQSTTSGNTVRMQGNTTIVRLRRLDSFSSLEVSNEPGSLNLNEKISLLNSIFGHVVEFPMQFLSHAKRLKPAPGLVSDIVFT